MTQIDEDSEPLAYRVVSECFDEFVNKKYEFICSELDCDETSLISAIECIKKKNPKPSLDDNTWSFQLGIGSPKGMGGLFGFSRDFKLEIVSF